LAKEKAEESDRLKSAFLQNISHEIRTPLNAICGFSEKINSPKIDDERRKLYAKIIVDNGLQLLNIVTDLLTISALETGQASVNNTTLCINQLLREQYATLTKQIGTKKIILSIGKSLNEETSKIIADKEKLERILANLISNAIKFTHEGSVDFGCQIMNSDLEFYVKDTGIGIDQSKHDWIFKRFVQADPEIQHTFGGTGLGLSICKGFVELMGGKIWLESVQNEGSTFYFTIPYVPAKQVRIDYGTTPNALIAKGKMVLLVENIKKGTTSLTDTFDELDFSLIIANNGFDALNICIDKPEIDIAIIDLELQGIDAQTTVTLIKEVRPEIQFFALTDKKFVQNGSGDANIFVNYLVKPITVPAIIDLVTYYGKSTQY
jgi:CheY-like chemotaxis protein